MLFPCSHSCGNPSFGNLNGLSLRQSVTSSPLLDLIMNPCSELASIVHFSRILRCLLVNLCHTFFFSGILSLRYPDTDQIWISVRYDGWNIYPRVISLVFIWPGKMMWCLAHLAGGPIVIVSFLASLEILPWGNRKTYFISCTWWILCVCKVRPLLEDHVNAISKHVCGTPNFNKNIWSTMLNFLYQLFKHCCLGNVMNFLSPHLNGFLLSILSWISFSNCPWERYTLEICV